MSWIKTISPSEANTKLKTIYNKYLNDNAVIDNVMMVHSLRPNTLNGHMQLYKNTLHNLENTLPQWFLELLGVYTSSLNKCEYCFTHHSDNLMHLIEDKQTAIKMIVQIENDSFNSSIFNEQQLKLLAYAKKLTQKPSAVHKKMITDLKAVGVSEEEILEANQVVAYFNYANRTVLGLGVSLETTKSV